MPSRATKPAGKTVRRSVKKPAAKKTAVKKIAVKKTVRKPRSSRRPAPVFVASEIGGASVAHGHTLHTLEERPIAKRFDEKSQRLVMWLGISVIMSVIIAVWISNLNSIVGAKAFSSGEPEPSGSSQEFEELSRTLRETLTEVRSGLRDLEDVTVGTTETIAPAVITDTAGPLITDTTEPALPNTLPN